MSYTFSLQLQIAETVREILGLKQGYTDEKTRTVNLCGLTRHNFILLVLYSAKEERWKLRIMHGGTKNPKDNLIEGAFQGLVGWEGSDFCRTTSHRTQYETLTEDADYLIEQAALLYKYIEENNLGHGSAQAETKVGVSFRGSQFDRLKERGATISGMFGNLVCQASGMNLLMMQAEYYVEAGEIDGVEFDEDGNVVSIYECQSWIHHGEELDDLHLGKILGTYLYDPEIIPTVRKVVVLAGAYNGQMLNILRNRKLELIRRDQPIELIVLITTRKEDKVGVEVCELS